MGEEYFDADLAEMVNYTDETAPEEMPVMERKTQEAPKIRPKMNEPMDAQYVPYPNKQRSAMDKLRTVTVWLGICGGISMLMWWFWMNGLMAMEAAYPCILASAVIGGIGAGRGSK